MILLVEDNPDDEALTLRALKKNKIGNNVYVVRDGAEALDFLFCTNIYADRDPHDMPKLILLDLKLSKMDGLGERSTHSSNARCTAYFLEGGAGLDRRLQKWSKLLHAQTGRLCSVCGICRAAWHILAGIERGISARWLMSTNKKKNSCIRKRRR